MNAGTQRQRRLPRKDGETRRSSHENPKKSAGTATAEKGARGQGLAWLFLADGALQRFDTAMAVMTHKGALAVVPAAIGVLDVWAGLFLLRAARAPWSHKTVGPGMRGAVQSHKSVGTDAQGTERTSDRAPQAPQNAEGKAPLDLNAGF